ncbi:Beta-phosphoglucomutase [Candidatus Rubidus massiliensis]|nr:MAG: hydrolase [Chlamydia sp. 32-24]CDZ79586.1 Beta-phosphoglucomutase [Candidatus Rubidus massiliensis]
MNWINSFHLFLFDFDGLLVNTEEVHYLAYQKMCASYGLKMEWNFEEYCTLAHYSADALKNKLKKNYPQLFEKEPNWSVLYAKKKEIVIDLMKNGPISLMPGVEQLLLHLEKAKIKRCVVTNSPKELVDVLKVKHKVLQTIPHWFTREDYTEPKPHPESYLHAIKKLHSENERIVGFEDTPRGITALLKTPAQPVLICTTKYPEISEFKKNGVFHFNTFEDINDSSFG